MKRYSWLAPLAAAIWVASACDRPAYKYDDSVPVSTTSNFSSSFGGATSSTTGVGGTAPFDPCALFRVRPQAAPAAAGSSDKAILDSQAISNQLPVRADLYLQVTDGEVDALKKGGPLIARPSGTPQATPLAAALTSLAQTWFDERGTLLRELQRRFKVTRPAWPNPWALRLLEHAGNEHMNPVRLRLKDTAWIALIIDNLPVIVDLKNSSVPLVDANAHPERIAAIYYIASDRLPTFGVSSCEGGKREFALGNEAMVDTFEIGSKDVQARMASDIDALTQLFTVARNCMKFDSGDGLSFHASTLCRSWAFFDTSTEFAAYQWALSDPAELYKPTPQNLASLIAALQDDTFDPKPFVSAPHPLPFDDGAAGEGGAGAGGAGGDGGAGGI